MNSQMNFIQLLGHYSSIEIPIIQRDYAHGRRDQGEVRSEFLGALHKAICLPASDSDLPLNLDFIYGSVEGEAFQPLDGQQRLTTLFLLHWYLAWKDGCGKDFQASFSNMGKSRFSYQVRPSSGEFFDALVTFIPTIAAKDCSSVSKIVTDQSWYFRSWRLDPTIQSALTVLDDIHERFRAEGGLYKRLIDTDRPGITFQLLDLKSFGLSDDLYIKMNARGKPLTHFETFKARFEQLLERLPEGNEQVIDGQKVSVAEFFSRRMDTRWSNFFWPYREKNSHIFDGAIMKLFRAIIMITRSPDQKNFALDITQLRNRSYMSTFSWFNEHQWLDQSLTETLITLLERWSAGPEAFKTYLPDARYFDEAVFFEKIITDPTELVYEDLVMLSGYAQFLNKNADCSDEVDQHAFQAWMRIVFNLAVNTEYNRVENLQRSLGALKGLVPHMITIVEHLAFSEEDVGGFLRAQVIEERIKARLLLADDVWPELIVRAESNDYFRGQIGFLLRFSGMNLDAVDVEPSKEVAAKIRLAQVDFAEYLAKAEIMFESLTKDSSKAGRLWERAFLTLGDYLLRAGINYSLLVVRQRETASWKRLLREQKQGSLLQQLWDRLDGTANISDQLQDIISTGEKVALWREAIIMTPEVYSYCQRRMIRRDSDKQIYLLRKTQMNGRHAELFTYCLFQDLKRMDWPKDTAVFELNYSETTSTEEEPGLELTARIGTKKFTFCLQRGNELFELYLWEPVKPNKRLLLILEDQGFKKGEEFWGKTVDICNLKLSVLELGQTIEKCP